MLARIPTSAVKELELEFQLGQGAIAALENAFHGCPGSASRLHAIYFDTPGHALRDGGFSLRVRRHDAKYIQTLKHRGAGGLFERDEWETNVKGPALDMDALADAPVRNVIGTEPLTPAFTVDVERHQYVWTNGVDDVEVSIDTGWITAGDEREQIAEIELESLKGSPGALFALAEQLHATVDLTLAFESKAQRGYRLAGHDGVAAIAARQAAVTADTTASCAFQTIAREGLVQIAGNARLLQRSHNPEVLHQTRVGLRRLRAAMTVFKSLLDPVGLSHARAETRWLAGELAPARDLDAFLTRIAGPDEIDDSPGRAAFLTALRLAQTEAYERALAALASSRYRAMLLSLGQWIELGPWTDATRSMATTEPVDTFVAPVLRRLHRRLTRGIRKFSKLDPEARHDLRKQAKVLRYASSFVAGVFDQHPRRRDGYMGAVREMQDQLGALNDINVARGLALEVIGRKGGAMAFAAGLEVGRMSGQEGQIMLAAAKAVRNYRRRRVFWPD